MKWAFNPVKDGELSLDHFAFRLLNVAGIVSSSQRHNKIVTLKRAFQCFGRRCAAANQRGGYDCGILDHFPGANPHVVADDSTADPRAIFDHHVIPEYGLFDLGSRRDFAAGAGKKVLPCFPQQEQADIQIALNCRKLVPAAAGNVCSDAFAVGQRLRIDVGC